jgi:mono/diheme cytochrome c family protein
MVRHFVAAVGVCVGLSGCAAIDALTPPTLPDFAPPEQAVWLNQNWTNEARHWFHHAPQGTSTIPVPYAWFMALEQPKLFYWGDPPMFHETGYLARFGFIPSPATAGSNAYDLAGKQGYRATNPGTGTVDYDTTAYVGNPGGLPVGFAITPDPKDPMTGKPAGDRLGFTCAACHTGHLTYQGTSIRVDGGPAVTNLDALTKALGVSLAYTDLLPWRFTRFAKRVLGERYSEETRATLKQRFDAVLRRSVDQASAMAKAQGDGNVYEGFARLDALNRIGNQVFFTDMVAAKSDTFDPTVNIAPTDAPVNYPHIWSTSWFDWVQYDGSIMQPMIRNAGEALGVSALVNLSRPDGLYTSSVLVRDIYDMERLLAGQEPVPAKRFQGLDAPKWPTEILGPIDRTKADRGAKLYKEHCQGCHLPPTGSPEFWSDKHWRTLPGAKGKYLVVPAIPVKAVGTDPSQAEVLVNRQVSVPELLSLPEPRVQRRGLICGGEPNTETTRTAFAWALAYVTEKVVDNRYAGFEPPLSRERRFQMDGNRPNCVRAPLAYSARPLNGIWATAPFLHNGSVLSIHDLLIPQDERPKQVCLGNPEFDPVTLGLVGACTKGTTKIDTTKMGNLATGHSFEGRDLRKPGVIGDALSERDRMALIEYLKTL